MIEDEDEDDDEDEKNSSREEKATNGTLRAQGVPQFYPQIRLTSGMVRILLFPCLPINSCR